MLRIKGVASFINIIQMLGLFTTQLYSIGLKTYWNCIFLQVLSTISKPLIEEKTVPYLGSYLHHFYRPESTYTFEVRINIRFQKRKVNLMHDRNHMRTNCLLHIFRYGFLPKGYYKICSLDKGAMCMFDIIGICLKCFQTTYHMYLSRVHISFIIKYM